jgi:hypothetical protein
MESTAPLNPALASANRAIRESIRVQFKTHCPDLYADYRKIRYPGGEGTDTPETRAQSVIYLFDMAREIVAPHYVAEPKQLDAIIEAEDGHFDEEDEGEEDESEEG